MNPTLRLAAVFASVSIAAFGATLGTGAGKAASSQKKASNGPAPALRVDDSDLGGNRAGGPIVTYAEILEPVQKAVVSIYSTKFVRDSNPLLRQFFPNMPQRQSKQQGLGSGVIVTENGYILTNNHVVEGADELKVSLADRREYVAKVIGTDPKTDVAVIKIEADKLPFATLADSNKLRVGDVVFAVGNPLDVGQTVTMGIVSAKNRSVRILEDVGGYEDFIQTDAAINMGNSGGALIDARGRLVGINSAILSPSRGSIGIGFAIPVNLAASIMKSLIETGTVSRGYLGVITETVTPDIAEQFGMPPGTRGVVISDITPGSAADRAGLKRNDVIVAANGRPVSSLEELRLQIAQMAPGAVAKLDVLRGSKSQTIDVTLDQHVERPDELLTGVYVKPLEREERRRLGIDARVTGLLVTEVSDTSPHAEVLAPGAVIMEINRIPVRQLDDAREVLVSGRNLVAIYYRGSAQFVAIYQQ